MALACVLGDLDLVRPLGRAGIACAAVAPPDDPVRWSRFTREFIDRSGWSDSEARVAGLIEFARRQAEPPVLYYSNDQDLILVSRNRDELGRHFRFTIADEAVVETLLYKTRAQVRFEQLGFPVPPARLLRPAAGRPPGDLDYPLLLKPVIRERRRATGGEPKGRRFSSAAELRDAWPELERSGDEQFAQRLIPGGEDRIESYHAYVDASGAIAGEYAGRKLRTWPVEYGNTTALEITAGRDVLELGRSILQGVGLRGVAKVDFKRDPEGRLWLLEINPRFNLWNHAGAEAGVNLPAIVFADLSGGERPPIGPARGGVTWCDPLRDRSAGLSRADWLRFAARSDTRWSVALDDPLPVIRGIAAPFVGRRLRKLGGRR